MALSLYTPAAIVVHCNVEDDKETKDEETAPNKMSSGDVMKVTVLPFQCNGQNHVFAIFSALRPLRDLGPLQKKLVDAWAQPQKVEF